MLAGIFLAAALQSLAPTPSADTAPAAQPAASDQLDAAELDDLRGGDGTVVLTEQNLRAVNSGNRIQADTVGSGNITLDNGALSGFSGVGNFVMNTGHNNNLQSSVSISVVMPPAP